MLRRPHRATASRRPSDVAGMTGKQMMQAIIDGKLPAPPIARTLTFWLVEVGDGYAAFEGETGPHLLNPMGTVHGGWALTLIDSAAGCAALTLLPAGVATTVETKANFTRPIMQIPAGYVPKAALSAAAARSCPPKRASSIPPDASSPMARRH